MLKYSNKAPNSILESAKIDFICFLKLWDNIINVSFIFVLKLCSFGSWFAGKVD